MNHSTELSASEWARDELFSADLGHMARRRRAISMLATMAERPAGAVLEVFETSAERQGAYDFLENSAVSAEALCASIGEATAVRASQYPYAFVAIDGSSLHLTDRQRNKGFGCQIAASRGH